MAKSIAIHKARESGDIQVAGETHVGLVRSSNEDSYLYINNTTDQSMFIGVADGMGGHEFGEVASFLVMKYLLDAWNRQDRGSFKNIEDVKNFLCRGLTQANKHIYHVNKELKIRWCMGTTATIGIFYEKSLLVAQIGDSRCYRLRKGKLKQITVDQSWSEEMIQNGILSREEAENHPLSNMLTNCVGAVADLQIEFYLEKVQKGDRYMFCSDGLSSMIDDELIMKKMRDNDKASTSVDELIKQALRHGGGDNVTVVCAFL